MEIKGRHFTCISPSEAEVDQVTFIPFTEHLYPADVNSLNSCLPKDGYPILQVTQEAHPVWGAEKLRKGRSKYWQRFKERWPLDR